MALNRTLFLIIPSQKQFYHYIIGVNFLFKLIFVVYFKSEKGKEITRKIRWLETELISAKYFPHLNNSYNPLDFK